MNATNALIHPIPHRVDRAFEIIVWGATGFTGRLVAQHLYQHYGARRDLRWAMGGRNQDKLRAIQDEWGGDAHEIPLVIADSHDRESIESLVKQTGVVCTTVGPYAKYGSELVEACARLGTDYCDLAGEVPWMQRMIDRHESDARVSGARIVHCCGFDSIPSDLGCYVLQRHALREFRRPCSQVKLGVGRMRGGISGGTISSLLNVMKAAQQDSDVMRVLQDPYALNPLGVRMGPDQNDCCGVHWDQDFRSWTGPFVMAMINTRVVRRSNALRDYLYGKEFRYSESQLTGRGLSGWAAAAGLTSALSVFMAMVRRRSMRELLNRWVLPQPGDGPSAQARESGSFEISLIGRGFDASAEKLTVVVTGNSDPGYGCTSKMLAESAMCLAKDADAITVAGGFWTPAACFGEKLVTRLEQAAGMRFRIVAASTNI